MSETTNRHVLPLLAAAQAQKEITHNEAIVGLDMLAHPAVESTALSAPPASPTLGALWIVGAAPTGSWTGKANALALWSASGWRFQAASEGMICWNKADARFIVYRAGSWSSALPVGTVTVGGLAVVGAQQAAIAAPSGGSVVDVQARSSLTAVLQALRTHGLIAT